MPMEIQRLRCKVNFKALTFVPHVRNLGDVLVNRLRYPGDESMGYLKQVVSTKGGEGAGKFVALHLRFDKVHIIVIQFGLFCTVCQK